MSKRQKLKRFQELQDFSNVFDVEFCLPKNWKEQLLAKKNLVLEVGCGKGAYTVGLAKLSPEKNFIGIDIKGERIWVGAKQAAEENLENVSFLRGRVNSIAEYFAPKSVNEIWITFPDPFPREKQAKHRLTSPQFLEIYKKVLVPGGKMHLKTDDQVLFEYSIDAVEKNGGTVLKSMANMYQEEDLDPVLQIQTDFEKKHLARGKKIYYLSFSL